jgi:RHS repeat-associated protein
MYQPTLGRFLSRDPLSTNGVDVLTDTGFYAERLAVMRANPWYYGGNWEHPYGYANNNPINLVDPSGQQAGPAEAGGCSPREAACIQQAKLAIRILKRNRETCFSLVLRLCRSKCSAAELTDCAIAALNRVSFSCSNPDKNHPDSRGRTESLCAFFKDMAARGWNLSWGQICACPVPCLSPIPNAANCSLCLVKAPIAMILYRYGKGKPTIDRYCPHSVQELANLLVHEATHNCVGGHETTNPTRRPIRGISDQDPACDVCGRPDTYAIEKAFERCL